MSPVKNLKIKHTIWNLTPLFKNGTDPLMAKNLAETKKQNDRFIKKWKRRSDYATNPTILKEALDEYENLSRNHGLNGKVGYYWWLRSMQDETDTKIKAESNKIDDFSNKIRNDLQFFEHTIARIPKNNQKKFLTYKALHPYRHYLEKLFAQSKFLLSDAEEKITNLLTPTSYEYWVKMTSGFLSKEEHDALDESGKKSKKNISELISLINSKKKTVRDPAAQALNNILFKYRDVAESEMNSVLAYRKVQDKLRGITRPDESRHVADDITTSAIDTLNKTVSTRFDIAKRFYTLKAHLLGVKHLEYHERNVEYGSINKKFPFPESAELVYKVLQNLDSEMADIFKRLLENGQMDIYPKKGKHGGAFCMYWLMSQPTYILLNHNDTLNDVLTLAHEFGHGVNNELIKNKQNALNFGTPISTAEVASTFMEDFVLDEILKTADDELKLSIQMMKLNSDISTVFRQVACYLFEYELHIEFRKKGYLSASNIGAIFQKHMSAYMGPYVEQSKGSENWWVYWSHIRTYFYVYSYASGLLISKSMQASVKKDPKFIKKVKQFLAAGFSASPQDIFIELGIDITQKTFWEKGLDEIDTLLAKTETLAKKLRKT